MNTCTITTIDQQLAYMTANTTTGLPRWQEIKKKKKTLFSGSIKPNITNEHTVQSSPSVHTVFKNKHVIDKVKMLMCGAHCSNREMGE